MLFRSNRTLQADYRSGGASRLNAVRAARQWGDRATLPLLRQALRDPDPAVVLEAAAAIERFRGRPTQPRPEAGRAVERQALPRRVARTR